MAHVTELIASWIPITVVSKETGIPLTTLIYNSSGKSSADNCPEGDVFGLMDNVDSADIRSNN